MIWKQRQCQQRQLQNPVYSPRIVYVLAITIATIICLCSTVHHQRNNICTGNYHELSSSLLSMSTLQLVASYKYRCPVPFIRSLSNTNIKITRFLQHNQYRGGASFSSKEEEERGTINKNITINEDFKTIDNSIDNNKKSQEIVSLQTNEKDVVPPSEDDVSYSKDAGASVDETIGSNNENESEDTAIESVVEETSDSVGVMQQVSTKKSNAVGDGDDDDDDDDDDDEEIDDSEEDSVTYGHDEDDVLIVSDENHQDIALSIIGESQMGESEGQVLVSDTTSSEKPNVVDVANLGKDDSSNISNNNDNVDVESVQVEVEYTIEEEDEDGTDDTIIKTDEESNNNKKNKSANNFRGGVGVRSFGERFKNRNRKKRNNIDSSNSPSQPHLEINRKLEQQYIDAWQQYILFPPVPPTYDNEKEQYPAFWKFLQQHQQSIDTDGKLRLDRRTLYAGLLAEFTSLPTKDGSKYSNSRKYLETETSHALQAAVSLATQPVWRKSLERPSVIRLYDVRNSDSTKNIEDSSNIRVSSTTTLAMQETITLALAHSFGAAMVVIDDSVLSSLRQQLVHAGCPEQETKPSVLVKTLIALAKEGKLKPSNATGVSISKCMENDLLAGMDDPFDERATSSYTEMIKWENSTTQSSYINNTAHANENVPLVVFLRTHHSSALLKSSTVLETIISECNSTDSRNLIVLGNGIDVTTTALPKNYDSQDLFNVPQQQRQPMEGSSPWFGFTPNNQNASGQNDPEGSRRFNIFLARTVDQNGTPGLVGAVAPPEAGNLFPHMMAMQARLQLEQQKNSDEDSPMRAELERWSQMLQEQIQRNGDSSLPVPQFFNATISMASPDGEKSLDGALPSPEIIQQALQNAMSELLDGLAQMSEDRSTSMSGQSPELQKAFAQVLRNENLRRGIAENLARAAPALSDPKCQGVLLSVFVPPPPDVFQSNSDKATDTSTKPLTGAMGNWFQKMLSHQEEMDKKNTMDQNEETRKSAREKRVRTMAAAAAVAAAQNAKKTDSNRESKAEKNLRRLESISRPILVKTPADPVRAKSWDAWLRRERGSVIFRQNRRILKEHLEKRFLSLQEHTGTRGAGSSLRQMLSVRLLGNEMDDVIQRAIELEAAKSQLWRESFNRTHKDETDLDVDITLSQLLVTENALIATEDVINSSKKMKESTEVKFIHPSTLESALSSVCHISPSPGGALSQISGTVSHRSKDEIAALAQDKHERALISQVVSPQDIGVTYDMVGGLTEVKELLRQSITYPLKFPHLYSEGIAREAVKGVLLFGPPGTGKTMLAKAVATEGGASFLSIDASSIENKWLGESEKNAKAVFTLARRLAPCVIFIDEVDSLLSSREGSSDDSAHGTLTSVKTTMMSEWDGLNSGTNGAGEAGSDRVIVIGSTNRPFDLDEAVLRRFPRRILVDLPDLETRTEILEVTLAENRLDPSVNLTLYAERLEGYSGSDLKEFCREAVVQISHEQARILDQGLHTTNDDITEGLLQRLRPVTTDDFDKALKKLKRSVSEHGRELARVWEWNDEYGEMKRNKKISLPPLANMYL